MKNRSKILLALLIVLTLMVGVFTITASAAKIPGGTKLFMKPNSNWTSSGARFAAYFFGDGDVWVSMADTNGDGIYEVEVPAGKNFTNVIFCRMNGSTTANDWNNRWNQTSDLVWDGTNNLYTIKDGTWDKGGGTWSTLSCTHDNKTLTATKAEPTCTAEGTGTYKCPDCGKTFDEALPKVSHNVVNDVCVTCKGQFTTVYVVNDANWSNVKFYTWTTDPLEPWPGGDMVKGEDGVWLAYVPAGYNNIIFNNGSGTQTADLKVPTNCLNVYNNSDAKWESIPGGNTHTYAHGVCSVCGDVNVTGLDGAGTAEDPYTIHNIHQLTWFRDQVNGGNNYSGKTVKLNADIDLNNQAWTPIGTEAAQFKGTFDGGNNTVSNLYINDANLSYAGFFGYANNAKINNLKVKNVNISAHDHVAGIAGIVYTGSVTNCHVSGNIILVASYAYAAGITADGYVTVSDCSVIADGRGTITVQEKTGAGGITGWRGEGKHGIYNCTVKNLNITAWASLGAITGLVHYDNTIDGCTVENVSLCKTRENGQISVGYAAGTWSNNTKADYTITITNNSFTNVSIKGTGITYTPNLYGSNYSYYDEVMNLVDGGNTFSGCSTDLSLLVLTETDLVNALKYNNAGVVINLGADITLNTKVNVLDGTVINLNSKTLYINVENSTFGSSVVQKSATNDIIIKNGNIVLGKDDIHVCDGYFLVNAGKTLVIDGVNLSGSADGIKGYAVFHLKTGANLDILDSTLSVGNNEYASGYIVYAGEGTATLDIVNSTVVGNNTNGVVHANTTIDNSEVVIDAYEHGINRSGVTINNSDVTIYNGFGRGITAQHGALVITGDSNVTIHNMEEASIELRNDQNATIDADAKLTLDAGISNTGAGEVSGNYDAVIATPNENGGYDIVDAIATVNGVHYSSVSAALTAAQAGDTVYILAGEFNEGLAVKKAITVIGETDAEGNNLVNFKGKLSVQADGATVKNLNFTNTSTACYVGAKNVLIEGCNLKGSNGLYQSYTSGLVTFRNCVITGSTYGIHFDGNAGGEIVIDGCTITGWTSFAASIKKVSLTSTKFEEGNYNFVRLYQEDIVIEDCTFNEKMGVDFVPAINGTNVVVNNITVENGEVADLFNESDLLDCEIIVDNEQLHPIFAHINGVPVRTPSLAEAFKLAVSGDEITIVKAGTYALSTSGKNITITGGVDGVVFEGMGAKNMGGANVTFNNVTFNWKNEDYKGLQHSGNLVYNNCTINGQVFLYGTSDIFNNCVFNQTNSNSYNVWTYSSKYVEFNGCTFNSAGKSVLVYHENSSTYNELVVTETTFNASQSVSGKAAIEIDTSLTAGAKITVDGATTATGFDAGSVSGNTLYNNKKGNEGVNNDMTIVVNNETVLDVIKAAELNGVYYTTVAAAFNAAKPGDIVTIFACEINGLTVNKGITVVGETDAEGNNLVTVNGKLSITADGAIVKNLNVKNPNGDAATINAKNVLVENCNVSGANAFRWCYTSGLVTFKDSTITAETWVIHFDGNAGGEIVVDNCIVTGWFAIGAVESVTLKNSDFNNGDWAGGRVYNKNVEIDGCVFSNGYKFDIATNDANVTVTNTTVENGSIADLFNENDLLDSKVEIDSVQLYPVFVLINGVETRAPSFADAVAMANDGDVVTLVKDITLDDTLTITKSITLDGANHKLLPVDGKVYNSAIMAGDSGWGDNHGETIKLLNLDISGFNSNYGVVRAQGVTLEMDGCVLNNNSVSNDSYAVVSLNFASATISNCEFVDNNDRVIDVNYNGDYSTAHVTIDGCIFDGNQTTGAGIVMRTDGTIAVKNSVFTNNTVSTNGNGATLYVGFGAGNEVTGCTFEGNSVTTSYATTKRFASAIFCDGCVVSGNVFGTNSAVRNGETISTIVAVGGYYGAGDISGNYWGGEAPVTGVDYTIEYNKYEVSVNDYFTDVNLSVSETIVYVVENAQYKYTTLQAAVDASKDGDVIVLLSDLTLSTYIIVEGEKTITLDLNGKTIVLVDEVATFSLDSVGSVFAVIGGATLKIDGNGVIYANSNGEIFYEEDGNIEILSGTFYGVDSIQEYVSEGHRVVELENENGDVYFGIVTNDGVVYIKDGTWWVGDYNTGVVAHPTVEIKACSECDNHYAGNFWFIHGVCTGMTADFINGINPDMFIGEDGFWYVDLDGKDNGRNPVQSIPAAGVDGFGIVSIEKTGSEGRIDTYTITYSNGLETRTDSFTVVNGIDGVQGDVGNAGEQGIDGPKGPTGLDGTNGNSNDWLVQNLVIISVICILGTFGIVLVLNHKRLNWWN